MASRISEVIYRLKDLFTAPSKKVAAGYERIRGSSRRAAQAVARDNRAIGKSFTGLEAGVDKLIGSWRALAAAVGGVSVVGSFRDVVNQADAIGKAASKIGLTSEALSRLAFAAEQNGVSFNTLEIGLQRMTRRIGDARNGSSELQKVFKQLGVDVDALAQLSPEEAFLQLSDAIRGVGNETEQLSLFIKLFDSEGANLIRVARQGSAAIKGLGDEAERLGRVFGGDFTDKAAAFNDQLGALEARITGAKVNAFTPVLEELVTFIDNVGFGDRVAGLTAELTLLEQRLQKPFVFDRRGVERRVDQIRRQLILIQRQAQAEGAAADAATAAAEKQREAAKTHAEGLDLLTDKYEAAQKARQAALTKETAELRAARAAQQRIETEFADLVTEVTTPERKDVFLLDVFQAISRANRALNTDQLDEAVRLARQGGDLLGALKEKGSETDGTLRYLAERLQAVASEAASQKTELELIDVTTAEQQLEGVKNKLAALKSDAAQEGTATGQAFVAALQAELASAELVLPPVTQPVIERRVVRDGDSFRHEVDRRGVK